MDIKIEIKEEFGFSDFCSRNGKEVFTKDLVKEIENEGVASISEAETNTEIKQVTLVSNLFSQIEKETLSKEIAESIESKTVTCGNGLNIDIKTEIEEAAAPFANLLTPPQKRLDPEDFEMGFNINNKDNEMETKIEIKEEEWWLDRTSTETVNISNDNKDGTNENFSSSESKSCFKEDASTYKTTLFFNEEIGKDIGSNFRMKSFEFQTASRCQSHESDVNDESFLETNVSSETVDGGEIDRITSCLKQSIALKQCHTTTQNIHTHDHTYHKTFTWSLNLKEQKLVDESKNNSSCDKAFKKLRNLKADKLIGKGKKCDKVFGGLKCFKKHKLSHKSRKLHKCDVCKKSFKKLSYCKVHKLVHKGISPYTCDICGSTFTQLSNLSTHKLIHENKRPYQCKVCEKTFTVSTYLKAHKLVHEGKKPHKCSICGKTFCRLWYLKKHKLVHDGKMPYKCEICDKAFTLLSSLKQHKLIHEGKLLQKCNICNKAFTSSYLKRHKLTHEDKTLHKCDVCDKAFTLSSLRKHKVVHEAYTFKCTMCDKTFKRMSNCIRHKLTHIDISYSRESLEANLLLASQILNVESDS